jgi:Cu-Zn family superoxide dismutase
LGVNTLKKWICFISITLFLSACGEVRPTKIDVELKNADGDSHGTATLQEKADGLMITLALKGLEPGPHGFHFHESGKCEPPDFESAGGHYNPDDKDHGLLNPEGAHAGDLPNIIAKPDGTVAAEIMAAGVTLEEGKTTLFKKDGTALIIHETADDGMSQPAGDAGKRIACGVIDLEEQKDKKEKAGKAEKMKEEQEK